MRKPLLARVRSSLLLFIVLPLLCTVSLAQQVPLKTQSTYPKSVQPVTGHNNIKKLTKIYDQQAQAASNRPVYVGDDAQLRRLYELEILKDPATGKIPADIREKELLFAKRMEARMGKNGRSNARVIEDWKPRGPYNVGGRTRALALDMENENIILAGGVSGGMWRSEDNGLTWKKTTGSNENQSVTAVVQDPREGYRNVWYYSTGERIGNSASAPGALYAGNGIYKSVDGGKSWNLLQASADNQPQLNSPLDIIFNLAIQSSTGHLFAATWFGIHRSTDGGASFQIVLPGYFDNWTDVLATPGGTLYASFESFGDATSNKGIFRSIDGSTWTNITPTNFPEADFSDFGRTVLTYSPSNENVVYAFADNFVTGGGYLWRYEHDAVTPTWTDLTANLPSFGGNVGDLNTQGGYNMVVEVHPTDPNVIFIGGTNLYRSSNGFTSPTGTRWIGGYSPLNDVSVYPNHHPDQHALVFYPSNPDKALSGNDGGVQQTENIRANNAGVLPVFWISKNNGYLTTQPYTVSIDPLASGKQLIAGFQDNGTWFTASESLTTPWTEEYGGDGSYNALADSAKTRYVSSQFGNVYRFEYASPFSSSDDYISFRRIKPAGAAGFGFVAPFILDPNNDNVMYFPAGRNMWRNDNLDGIPEFNLAPTPVNWNKLLNSEVPATNTITALALSRLPANRLYYGTNKGLIYRMDNANIGDPTKVDIATGKGLPTGYVICLTVDPSNADRVFAVFSNYNILSLFYSENAGETWTNIGGNLEETPTGLGSGPSVRWLSIEGNNDRYYVGTSIGLYSTTTLAGANTVWTQEDPDGIGANVVPMVKTREDGFAAVATHGNGLFSGQFEVTPLKQPTLKIVNSIEDFEVFVDSPPTIIDISTIFTNTEGGPISYSIINTNPALLTATIEGNLLIITYAPGAKGKGTIGLIATSGKETLSEPFTITVRELDYVLYNQNKMATGERPSQLFTDFSNSLAQSADDFTIPEGQTWTIEKVYAPGVINGSPIFDAARVVIYADSAGSPARAVYESNTIVPASGISNSNLELTFSKPAELQGGKYWISVFAELAYGTGNQWFWLTTDEVSGSEAYFRDENDLFGIGAVEWTPLAEAFGDEAPIDMVFILFGKGTGIPAPAAPSDLSVLYNSATSFELTWKDNSDDEIGFLVERSTNGNTFTKRATVGANDTTYTDTDFFNPTLTYYYRVAAIGISDTSAYSNVDETAIIPAPPVAKPATLVFSSFFLANWQPSVGAKYYELDVFSPDSTYLPGYKEKVVWGTSHLVVGTKAGKKYLYRLRAVNAGGESKNSNVMPVAPIRNLILSSVCSDNPQTLRRWKVTNPNEFAVDAEWSLFRTNQKGKLSVPPGETYFTTNTVRSNNTVILVWLDDKYLPHIAVRNATNAVCTGTSQDVAAGRGIDEEEGYDTDSPFIVDVYPNPVDDKFNIMIASPFDDEVDMEIFDIKGDRIHQQKAYSNTIIEVDARSYPSGAYILKAKHVMYEKTLKLIKK